MKGQKTGGRKKGTPNKATAAKVAEVTASGLTPLDHMLAVMRDPNAPVERRDEMAKASAPYVHPRLHAVGLQQVPPANGQSSTEITAEKIKRVIFAIELWNHQQKLGRQAQRDAVLDQQQHSVDVRPSKLKAP